MLLHLHAKPNARRTKLQPGPTGRWTVRLAAPPQDGQANAALLAFLAEVFGLPKSRVALLSGHTAPFKKGGVERGERGGRRGGAGPLPGLTRANAQPACHCEQSEAIAPA